MWFAQGKARFTLVGISKKIKFCHVISQLDHRYATEVEDIITSPPDQHPYTTLRTKLVRQLSPSREQRIRQLITLEQMGDRKPSQFLRHLRSLAPDVPDDFLQSIWPSQLPPKVQTILTGLPEGSLDSATRCADGISEVAPQLALTSVGPLPDSTTLLQGMKDLSRQVAALNAKQDRLHISFRDPRLSSQDPCSKIHRSPPQLQEPPTRQQIPLLR
jgi:hypothetical protein